MKVVKTLPFSQNAFDQWRLTEAGGKIGFDKKGTPVFQFTSNDQYNRYLELNKERVVS